MLSGGGAEPDIFSTRRASLRFDQKVESSIKCYLLNKGGYKSSTLESHTRCSFEGQSKDLPGESSVYASGR